MRKIIPCLVLLTELCSFYAFAGTTGKIRGFVKDAASGDPLLGANVVITKVWVDDIERDFTGELGAATNLDGEFIILKIPPGIYSIKASMMGYTGVTQQQVRVFVDGTSNLNFNLQQTVLEAGEVVIHATRDIIQLDVAATESYISTEQYHNTPFANRIEDVLGLQSGVSGNIIEGEIQIRAGETREVGFLMDGMNMVDRKFNRPVISVQPGVVQEIKIMRNGFNAEYGQSRSGMINVVTKNPGDRLNFSVDYQWEPAGQRHYGRDYYDTNWRWEWRLMAGPNAMEGGELFLPEGIQGITKTWIGWNKFSENLLGDNNPDNDLTPEEALELWKWRHRPMEYGNKHGHNIDITLSGRAPLLPWRTNFLLGAKYEYHPFTLTFTRDHYDEKLTNLKLVNRLTANLKLTLTGIYSEVRSVTQSDPTSDWREEDLISYSGGGSWEIYYPHRKPAIDRYTTLFGLKLTHTVSSKLYYEAILNHFYIKWWIGRPNVAQPEDGRYFHGRLYYDPQSGWIPKERGLDDAASGFRMYGGGLSWDNSYNRRTSFTSSMTYQFHPAHELKTGLEFNFEVLHEDRLHWHNEDSTQVFNRYFHVKPYEIALFVQDKIEFQGMIANLGLRLDYFNPNSERPNLHVALDYDTNRDIYESFINGTYPTFKADPKFYFSPRIGISHPLSERSKIYFNYGHFVQTPPTMGLFSTVSDGSMPRMQWIGDPNLPLEKTIAYELGYDMGLSDFFQLHVGAFYKDYYDITSGMVYAHSDQSLIMEWPSHDYYSEIRGLEIEIRKTTGRFITGWFNYNYIKKSQANLEIPNIDSDVPIMTDDPNIGRNGLLWGVPRSDIIFVEPNGSGVIILHAPPDWGPRINNYSLLGNTNLSFLVYYKSGEQKEHPRGSFRDQHPDVRFRELPRYWANMRLSRMFNIKKARLELYMDVSSILHSKFRNPPGGQAGEDYYDDLWKTGNIDQVGTDKMTNPLILRTESDDVYWGQYKQFILGLRFNI